MTTEEQRLCDMISYLTADLSMTDADCMQLALRQATKAGETGEVPVGAVLVHAGNIIAAAHNSPISLCDPTAHAEILALRAAATHLGEYRLPEAELFVTLEPCLMCFGAMLHARIRRLVYAADDPKVGFSKFYSRLAGTASLNHSIEIESGLMAEESAELLREFFRKRR